MQKPPLAREPSSFSPRWPENGVSVIVRFHDASRLPLLREALASLAAQEHASVQAIVVIQNGNDDLTRAIQAHLTQAFPQAEPHRVLNLPIPTGEDGRSRLLNAGLQVAQGRYLAFLDYDDIVYPRAYATLIQRLQESRCAVAVGGCILVQRNPDGTLNENFRRPYTDRQQNKLDLMAHNFIPIHSFLMDRSLLAPSFDLRFRPDLNRFEDYELLLRLAAHYDFDFENWNIPVAEYRLHTDGSNTIPTKNSSLEQKLEWERAQDVIDQLKKNLRISVSALDAQTLVNERDQLLRERGSLPFRAAAQVLKRRRKIQSFLATWKQKP